MQNVEAWKGFTFLGQYCNACMNRWFQNIEHFLTPTIRDNLFEELLQEEDDIVAKRKHARGLFHVLEQVIQVSILG